MLWHRLSVHDARGLTPLSYSYTPLGVPARQTGLDGGTAVSLGDAGGQPLYGWDADGTKSRHTYDGVRRPLFLYSSPAATVAVPSPATATLAAWVWGDTIANAALYYQRGNLYCSYDGSGSHTHYYDGLGNEYGTVHYPPSSVYTTRPDWGNLSTPAIDTLEGWGTFASLDILGRPGYVLNSRTSPTYTLLQTTYYYDRGGVLYRAQGAGGGPGYVQGSLSTTDAMGRPVKVTGFNGVVTTYSYDAKSHRLTRQLTVRNSDGRTVQDFRYFYDAVGNITLRRDEAQQAVFYANSIAFPENDYTYDSIYRLIKAGGREHVGSNAATSWNDSSRMGTNTQPLLSDETAMRPYIQYYEYDGAGNMLKMRHTTTGGTGNWTRNFVTDSSSNKMTGMWMGTTMPTSPDESYSYDGRGNMLDGMSHLLSMGYNELNQLEHLSINSTKDAYYQYGGDGQRWRKTVISTSGGSTTKEQRAYQTGGVEEYTKTVGGSITLERQTHRIQGAGANVLIERRLTGAGSGEAAEMIRYQYGDQLNSCGLELDETGDVISYEEYYPFGSTSFQSGRTTAEVSLKRYRYTGKERDEESGLSYHGARYYAPWLCRWTQADPINSEWYNLCKGKADRNLKRGVDEMCASPYEYSYDNPINYNDPTGEQPPVKNPQQILFENFLKEFPQIDMRNAPAGSPTNAAGYARNAKWFWKQVLKTHPEMFSPDNISLIKAGSAPNVDEIFIRFSPSSQPFSLGKLIHHHLDQLYMAIPLPKKFHSENHRMLHKNYNGQQNVATTEETPIVETESVSKETPSATTSTGTSVLNKVGGGAGKALSIIGIFGDFFSFKAGNPESMLSMFPDFGPPKVGKVYKDHLNSGMYFSLTSYSDKDGLQHSEYDIYSGFGWDAGQKKYIGINKVGHGSSTVDKKGGEEQIIFDNNGKIQKHLNTRTTTSA